MKKQDPSKQKELLKAIEKLSDYSLELFSNDALTYIKAIQEHRMLCIIKNVSPSGMSSVIKFNSCERSKVNFYYRQYWNLFKTLGYQEVKDKESFRIHDCGVDTIFNTNYNIIHKLKYYGFITKLECDKLSKMTPIAL